MWPYHERAETGWSRHSGHAYRWRVDDVTRAGTMCHMSLPSSVPPIGAPGDSGPLSGPWTEAFWFSPGTPLRSKSNFRRGTRRSASAGDWGSLQRFEQTISTTARMACPSTWQLGDQGAAVSERPMIVSVVVARSVIDAGNFSKSLLDACEGVVFHTDASVVASTGISDRGRSDQRCVVGFARLEPGTSLSSVAEAVASLSRSVVGQYSNPI